VFRIADVFAGIATILARVESVLSPIPAILPAVANVLQPVPAVERPWPLFRERSRQGHERKDQGRNDNCA
jgi:hypothetical protein